MTQESGGADPHINPPSFIPAGNRRTRPSGQVPRSDVYKRQGFQWLTSDDADHNTLSFLRIGTKGETLAVVVNFSGEAWSDYQVALPTGGKWTEVFTTDDAKYGGSDIHNGTFEAVEGEYHSRPFSAKITVPALGVVFLKPED